MTNEDILQLVYKHEHSIDTLTQSITRLADSARTTNNKLDDLLTVISRQNVLAEKMSNMDKNLKESFDRVHSKLRIMEDFQTVSGCPSLKVFQEKQNGINENLLLENKNLNIDIKDSNNKIKDLEKQRNWLAGIIILSVIGGILKGVVL